VGKSYFVRLYTTARVNVNGKFVPITAHGKIALSPQGKAIRKQFAFKLAEVSPKYPNIKCAALGLLVAQLKADIETAERSLLVQDEKPDGDMTVSDFFNHIYLPHIRREKEASTVRGYNQYWRCYLEDYFNGTKTLKGYEAWQATNLLEGLCTKYSENTVAHIRNLCSGIFGYACAKGFVPRNVWRDAKQTSSGRKTEDGVAYTQKQVEDIIATLNQIVPQQSFTAETAQMAIVIAFYSGLRPSEIVGLQWSCIDIDYNTIHVRGAHLHGEMKSTKTGKNRTVRVPAALAPTLNSNLRLWRTKRPANGWVFPNQLGTAPISMPFLSRFILRHLRPLGMEWEGFYACRRGFATRMVLLGMQPAALAQLLGNSVPVVFRHYFQDKDCNLGAGEMNRIADELAEKQLNEKQLNLESQKSGLPKSGVKKQQALGGQ